MIRILPRFAKGSWSGSGADPEMDARGFYLALDWFGFTIEISLGRLS